MKLHQTVFAWIIAAGLVMSARGDAPTAEQRAALERLALGKARRLMVEQVRGLPLGDGLTVGAWIKRRVESDRLVAGWARSLLATGIPRVYSDGVVEVDVRIEPAALLERLVEARKQYLADAAATPTTGEARDTSVSEARLRSAARQWPILWVTGRGSLKEMIGSKKPIGWEDVTPEGVEIAKRAARADALARLVDEAGKLRVTNAKRLNEFLESGPEVRSAVQEEIDKIATVTLEPASDQICTAAARVPTGELIRALTAICQRTYKGDAFSLADFREMAILNGDQDLAATGLAMPPNNTLIRDVYEDIELNAPMWRTQSIRAVGRHLLADGATADDAARRELARLDGMDRLRELVKKLVIQDELTVEAYIALHSDLKNDIILFLSGTRIVSEARTAADGALEVDVELPLRRLWEILRRAAKRIDVEPPPATRPAEGAER